MHKKLNALEKLHAECKRTDGRANALGLHIASRDEEATRFHWGLSELIKPRKRVEQPMRLTFSRDTFLMPDSNITGSYDLGFEEDWETGSEQLFIAYRLNLVHEFNLGGQATEHDFPVTVFQELVSGKWRATARIRYGEEKNTPYARPSEWTSLLAQCGLDGFGELADGLSAERARTCIDQMFGIAAKHVPTLAQYEKLIGKRVLRA